MNPSLSQVLSSGGNASSFNLFYLIAGFAAFLAAAFSAAKGYEVFRRGRLIAPALLDTQTREREEKLSFMVDELKIEKQQLSDRNAELQIQLDIMNGDVAEVKKACALLEKSGSSLAKENAKLRSEKEELTLKTVKPLLRMTSVKKTIKKEAGRKPKRVSRKGR